MCLKKKVLPVFCIGILSFPLVGNLSSLRDIGNNRKKDSEPILDKTRTRVEMTEGDKKEFAA
jgi:hypothetical protein